MEELLGHFLNFILFKNTLNVKTQKDVQKKKKFSPFWINQGDTGHLKRGHITLYHACLKAIFPTFSITSDITLDVAQVAWATVYVTFISRSVADV